MTVTSTKIAGGLLVAVFCLTTATLAQQGVPPSAASQVPPPAAVDATTSYRVDIVLTRSLAEKRLSSLPFALVVSASQNYRASLRLGMNVPTGEVRSTRSSEGTTTTAAVTEYVGTNIDCLLSAFAGGLYRLSLTLNHSMLAPAPLTGAGTGATANAAVAYRVISLNNQLVVREGQPTLFSVGVDQITGETIRAEVTVTTVK